METERLQPDDAGLTRAASLLRDGATVAFPTETVYGLGADATNSTAVAGIYQAKDRPRFNPLIVHLPSTEAAWTVVQPTPTAKALADAFWPGALTLVLPRRSDAALSDLVTAGLSTVAVRVPANALARNLLTAVGRPVAAPSANPSGQVSATTAQHVLDGLGGRIDAVLDGGACPVGVESTIVGCAVTPTLLRPGGVTEEAIANCLGRPLAMPQSVQDRPTSPGQLASHYAPRKPVWLNIEVRPTDALWLGFGPGAAEADVNLSPEGDLKEAAASLFAALRALDARPGTAIAVSPIPDYGLGAAINDRLRRAAAPRR